MEGLQSISLFNLDESKIPIEISEGMKVKFNPLLADIFERLGYMERKGSGF